MKNSARNAFKLQTLGYRLCLLPALVGLWYVDLPTGSVPCRTSMTRVRCGHFLIFFTFPKKFTYIDDNQLMPRETYRHFHNLFCRLIITFMKETAPSPCWHYRFMVSQFLVLSSLSGLFSFSVIVNWRDESSRSYMQVGDGDTDHYCWQRPEDMTSSRFAYRIDAQHPGSDLAGETAAAMAAASLVFRRSNQHYADELLIHAKQVGRCTEVEALLTACWGGEIGSKMHRTRIAVDGSNRARSDKPCCTGHVTISWERYEHGSDLSLYHTRDPIFATFFQICPRINELFVPTIESSEDALLWLKFQTFSDFINNRSNFDIFTSHILTFVNDCLTFKKIGATP